MTTIYLIRHAEAEGNLYRIAQGQYNSLLTDRGARQVAALERRFADIHVDAVYSSDLYRTCATAAAIYKPKGLELHRRTDLREICVGVWEQRTWGDIARADPEQMANFSLHPERWQVAGGEAPAAVLRRVRAAVEDIARKNEGRTVAVFSHGYAIRLLLASLQGYTLEQLAATPVGDNTAVSKLEVRDGKLEVVFRDDNSHLRTPEYLAGETKGKRANGLEPGLRFLPLCPAEQAALLDRCARETGVAVRPDGQTLVGYLGEEPVGLLQMGTAQGQIALAYIQPEYRGRGFGVQLIGQAVRLTRETGGETVLVRPGNSAAFWSRYGFRPGKQADVLEKGISFDPAYLALPPAEV